MTYEEAIQLARNHILTHRSKGTKCPVCGRPAKVYSRHINGSMAFVLIALWKKFKKNGPEVVHVVDFIGTLNTRPDLKGKMVKGDWVKLRFWNLIQPIGGHLEDKKYSGQWFITQHGIDFVERRILVPYTAFEFRSDVLGFDQKTVSIDDTLKKQFSYSELMRDL